jgi:glycosyltransferase involved in cell wall biosynthesis
LDIFPPTQGGSVKIYSTIKWLSLLGNVVYFVTAENDGYYEVRQGMFRLKKYPAPIAHSPLTPLLKKMLTRLGIPADIHVLYHPLINVKLWLKTLYVTLRERVDLLQAEFTAFAIPTLFAKALTGVPTCLVEHNVESFQLPEITRLGRWGRRLVRFVEKLVCRLSDRVIAITPQDKVRITSLGVSEGKIRVIPHGVELAAYRRPNGEGIRERYGLGFPTLVFHGVYSYKPNRDAVEFIAKKLLPELEEKGLEVKALAIGAFPPTHINHPRLVYTDVVKALPDHIAAADIGIVPIQAGGGLRMKILEYFAAGKPVIATPKGAEGIPAEHGKEIILAPLEDFATHIVKLVKSPTLRRRLAEGAHSFVQTYDWRNICQRYIRVYREVLSSSL